MKQKLKKLRPRFSVRVFFTLFVVVELLLIDLFAFVLIRFLRHYFDFMTRIPDSVWIVVVSLVLGSALTSVWCKYFFAPVRELKEGMRRVGEGDFDVTLSTDRGFREIREINSGFNTMAKELGATEILQTEFVSNVSHEFKTPINAIEGYATLLQSGDQDFSPQQNEYVEKILFNTNRLSKLVGNMLLLSKVDNQQIQSRRITYRLDEQIRQSLLSLEPRWTEAETEFDVDMECIEYTGSENLLMHVWDNLIENAVKYGPRGGLVRLKLLRREGEIRFTIEDEGPGIGEEDLRHIFDRFYQADTSRKDEGNGLGLALVKQILKTAGGTISVENLPEKGCRFTVILKEN